jgi:uncharacterized protein DUF6503
MKRLLISLLLLTPIIVNAQRLSSEELLQKSIDFHDPQGKWGNIDLTLVIDMVSPRRSTRTSKVSINNGEGTFELRSINNGIESVSRIDALDSCSFTVNYRPVANQVQADSLRLTPTRARFMRNYYSYLYGLPMKLKDEGTIIDPNVQRTKFQDKPVLSLKVTYDEAVGSDIWYFYFSPETYAMIGYRFYHDEAVNDGEYITLEGMSIQNGFRVPKDRAWYTNKEDKLLGTDYLISMEIKN